MTMKRREFLQAGGAVLLGSGLAGCAGMGGAAPSKGKVVVIGAGYGGATCAKYLRKWSGGTVDVTMVERSDHFISCPLSNLVIGGSKQLSDLTVSYDGLKKHGVNWVKDEALSIDPVKKTVKLKGGTELPYDRLVLSPGVDLLYDSIPGLNNAAAQEKVLHAWKAGPQTVALRKQLEAMRDGGVVAMHVPKAPYRCPPGPYERACQIAHYLKTAKPKSKLIVLDANDKIQSKEGLFKKAFAERYAGLVDYRPNSTLLDVDVATLTAKLEFDNVKADVLNVIPPQRAGAIAAQLGMNNANGRFCQIDFLTFESTAQQNIHILGDAIQSAPLMPKSGHMANQHGKVCAAAIIALLSGEQPMPQPMVANTCYSFINDKEVVHVSSVHRYDAAQKTMLTVEGSGGLSPAPTALEGEYAFAWANNIWADTLA